LGRLQTAPARFRRPAEDAFAADCKNGRPSAKSCPQVAGKRRNRLARRCRWPRRKFDLSQNNRGIMSSTFDIVAEVISETSEIPRDQITPDVHAIDDLGIDSLDFLDIVFALDKKFGIKIPLEAWTEDVNQGRAKVEDYFVLKNLCARIDELVAAKNA
jgi:acyl carrier protein